MYIPSVLIFSYPFQMVILLKIEWIYFNIPESKDIADMSLTD